jgi:hypothetical protein
VKLSRPMVPCALLTTLVFIAACSSQRDVAQQSLYGADNAFAAVAADAHKYPPDKLASLGHRLSDLKGSFDMRDYAAVLRDAPTFVADAQRLGREAADRKQQAAKALDARWSDIASSLPELLDRIELRIDALSKTNDVPKRVDLAAARSAMTDANAIWQKAQIAFATGEMEEAVGDADDGNAKAEAAATAVDLNPPAVAYATK